MSWPAHIQQDLDDLSDTDNIRNHFYPLYLDILLECFPRNRFRICPLFATPSAEYVGGLYFQGGFDVTVAFVVETRDLLEEAVFFVDICPPTSLQDLWLRKTSDGRMRNYMKELYPDSKPPILPRLHGISAFGLVLLRTNGLQRTLCLHNGGTRI
ncbi:hypothetical protein P691DRAFT_802174 [Macrolepiota fuliginosa MF-IS2]|uniref:Uncharacterized protein n=1 Tax=Macrolepiota fuliginosa MF-IS2 TaxID=1400762 RepID=A0A9P5XD10_9AGAR|nr:hypothetical protein P691DRAFT_802174 [Macrolepiota fuliginosa MF-IS2]